MRLDAVVDISAPVTPDAVSWQDRFPTEVTWHSRGADGHLTTNSSWRLHAHAGTHLDAPLHHLAAGDPTDRLDLGRLLGPCRVLDVAGGGDVTADDLRPAAPRRGERLLLRTANSRRDLLGRPVFTADYAGVTAEAARYLAEEGVGLVGIDYLSVEPAAAATPETHRALLGAGIAVLEGLLLTHVPPGEYVLLFLPLRLIGAEAAPGRAVLLPPFPVGGA